jgi:c-di-GMP-binding flagellar brake protein YcgR
MSLVAGPLVAADIASGDRRYEVRSRLDIISTMRALAEHHTLVTAYGTRAADFIVTAVLAVHANDDLLVFDYGAEQAQTERVLDAGDVRFITQLDHIRIQFTAPCAGTLTYEGAPAFLTRFPDVMQRLQRREYYRVRIPLGSPLWMVVTPNAEKPDAAVSLRVLDISCGGIALTDVPIALGATVGQVFRNCRMNLPGLGTLTVDFRVVRTVRDDTRPGSCLIAGPFVDLSNGGMALVQRYINRIERERLAREH